MHSELKLKQSLWNSLVEWDVVNGEWLEVSCCLIAHRGSNSVSIPKHPVFLIFQVSCWNSFFGLRANSPKGNVQL